MAAEACGVDQAGRRLPLIFDKADHAGTAALRATSIGMTKIVRTAGREAAMDYCYVRRVGRLALSSGGTSTPYAPAITSHVNGLAAIVGGRSSATTLSAKMIAAAIFVAVLVTVSSPLREGYRRL
jgi:hypothetical protein